MFVDEAKIHVEGGRGGDGCVSFRREKYRPHGGPDGGDGGRGGSVILAATNSRSTLAELHRRRRHRARPGGHGGSNKRKGATGADLVIDVPPGTVARDGEGRVMADLATAGQSFVAASGGRGGRGNLALIGEAGPLPGFAEKGEPGESRVIELELKLVADVAIVGFPNAGKSSLISRVSRAKPRIADYPFTTVEPNLGVVVGEDFDFVATDVPGLVEGAHLGRGMGAAFLRHVERASVILYLVDMSPDTGRRPVEEFLKLEEELGLFNPELLERGRVVAANKMDLRPPPAELDELRHGCEAAGVRLFTVSAVTGEGVGALVGELTRMVGQARSLGVVTGPRVEWRAAGEEGEVLVEKVDDRFMVSGGRVERMVRMTDWNSDEAREHLARRLRAAGVEELLERRGAREGDEVEIAGRVFEYFPEGGPARAGGPGETAGEDGGPA